MTVNVSSQFLVQLLGRRFVRISWMAAFGERGPVPAVSHFTAIVQRGYAYDGRWCPYWSGQDPAPGSAKLDAARVHIQPVSYAAWSTEAGDMGKQWKALRGIIDTTSDGERTATMFKQFMNSQPKA